MPIDARIPLSVFANSPDLGEIAGRWQQIRGMKQRQKIEQMQMDEEQRRLDEAAAVRQAAAGAVTPQTTQQVNMPGVSLASYAAPHSVSDGSVGPQQSFSLPTSGVQLPGSTDSLTTGPQFDRSKMLSNLASNPQTAAQVPAFQSQFDQQDAQAANAKHQQVLQQFEMALKSGQVDAQTRAAFTDATEQVGRAAGSVLQSADKAGAYQQALQQLSQSPNPMVRKMLENAPPQYQPGMDSWLQEQVSHAMTIDQIVKRTNPEPLKQTPGVEVPFSPAVAAQKVEIARASRPVTAPLPGGSMSEEAKDMAAHLYLQTGNLPSLGMGKDAAGLRRDILNRAAELGKGQNVAENKAAYGTYQQQAHKAQPQFVAIDTANQHLDLVGQAAKALDNGNVQALNNIANTYGVAVGNDPKTTFDAIVTVAGPEVVKASANTGQMAESEIQKVRSNLQSGMSPKQIESNVSALRGLMDGKKKALQKNLNDLKGGNITGSTGASGSGGNSSAPASDHPFFGQLGGTVVNH